jgi:hypothetical protein
LQDLQDCRITATSKALLLSRNPANPAIVFLVVRVVSAVAIARMTRAKSSLTLGMTAIDETPPIAA